jgi:hypothetical protein
MRLVDFRYEEIKKIIVKLFADYGINTMPITGFEVAVKLGIKVLPYSAFQYQDGIVETMKKASKEGFSCGGRIFYNDDSSNSYERINWTIMHEIAHIILEHLENSELAEAEAEFFAGYAIAPIVLIHKLRIKDFGGVSETFGLRVQASVYAFNRYKKWLYYGSEFYTDYEIQLCENFGIAV